MRRNGSGIGMMLAICLRLSHQVSALPADFVRKDWVAGLHSPLAMRFAPDGRLFVTDQACKVWVMKDGIPLPAPFATVPCKTTRRESMMGVAFDPNFSVNGYVYLHYDYYDPVNGASGNRITRLTASTGNPDVADPKSETIILTGDPEGGDMGGAFFFGKDGMLYAGTGQPGSQDLTSLSGKVLRINAAAYPKIIPPDNPFVGKGSARPEIYAYGLREPWTGAVDTVTGNIAINDVDDGSPDWVYALKSGANYGYGGTSAAGPAWINLVHNGYTAIAGAAFYEADAFPSAYKGSYFFGDLEAAAGTIRRQTASGQTNVFETGLNVIQLDVGPDGNLYALTLDSTNNPSPPWTGRVQRISYLGSAGIASVPFEAQDSFGPDRSVVDPRNSGEVHFLLGAGPAHVASVKIYDRQGRLIESLDSQAPGKILTWNFSRKVPARGECFYRLQVSSQNGSRREKSGGILFMD